MTRAAVALVLGAAALACACGRRANGQEPAAEPPPPVGPDAPEAREAPPPSTAPELARCTREPFAETLPIAEASGAVWLPRDGGVIVVVADSGHDGDYLVLDAATGRVLEDGKLPLHGAGDDLEGLAADGDTLWAITSGGWMRSWTPKAGGGYKADVRAYRIDPDDACELDSVNCGHNYEGLCLGATGAGSCAGYAAAKADGTLVCLVRDGDRWIADHARSIAVAPPDVLAACDITADGALWTGDNLFSGSMVRRLAGGEVTATARLGDGFPEAMAIAPDGTIYRFSDTGSAPSRATKFRCR